MIYCLSIITLREKAYAEVGWLAFELLAGNQKSTGTSPVGIIGYDKSVESESILRKSMIHSHYSI
jgi:hypothetical protein